MPDAALSDTQSVHQSDAAHKRLKLRRWRERGLHVMGILASLAAVSALGWLVISIIGTGYTAFYQSQMTLDLKLEQHVLDPSGMRDPERLRRADYRTIIQTALQDRFMDVTDPEARLELFQIVSASGATNKVRQMVYRNPDLVGQAISVNVPTSDDVDQFLKGFVDRSPDTWPRKVSDQQIAWVDELVASGEITSKINWGFFTRTDSRDPELAGIAGALMGSLLTLFVTVILAVPIGIGAAIYLEEFASKNLFTDLVEINLHNLTAIPPVIFGLFGLAVFLNYFGMPRSTPLVGGVVLALMTLPTVIIATMTALRTVPLSIVQGALSLGASKTQAVFHHKIPLAAPTIVTGVLLGMAQALGQAAPLLMIGMVAFVTEAPSSVTEPASALPVQIFLWADNAEQIWNEHTAAAIIAMLFVLVFMNGLAIFLRSKLEKKW